MVARFVVERFLVGRLEVARFVVEFLLLERFVAERFGVERFLAERVRATPPADFLAEVARFLAARFAGIVTPDNRILNRQSHGAIHLARTVRTIVRTD